MGHSNPINTNHLQKRGDGLDEDDEIDPEALDETRRHFEEERRRPGARVGSYRTQQLLAGAAQRSGGGGAGAGIGDDDDANAPVKVAPLMDAKILETVNFSIANLNAYLQARGTQEGDTPLHVAAQEGHVEVAYWLLMEGQDCRAVNQFGDTPLHFAARWCARHPLAPPFRR